MTGVACLGEATRDRPFNSRDWSPVSQKKEGGREYCLFACFSAEPCHKSCGTNIKLIKYQIRRCNGLGCIYYLRSTLFRNMLGHKSIHPRHSVKAHHAKKFSAPSTTLSTISSAVAGLFLRPS